MLERASLPPGDKRRLKPIQTCHRVAREGSDIISVTPSLVFSTLDAVETAAKGRPRERFVG